MQALSYINRKNQTYYLYTKDITLKNGRTQTIYYFVREKNRAINSTPVEIVPDGYYIVETTRTAMPVLKRIEKISLTDKMKEILTPPKVDTQYQELLELILYQGIEGKSRMVDDKGQETTTISYLAPPPLRYDLSEGRVPLITERDCSKFWKSAVGEMFAFINGSRTTEQLEKFGCKWWKFWATKEKCAKRDLEEGDLGDGSYGVAFHNFPCAENTFNQFDAIVKQIKAHPELKTHFVSPWIPQYNFRGLSDWPNKTVVQPCWGWLHFRVFDGKLCLNAYQRSADVPIGLPSNLIAHSALLLAMAQVLGLKPWLYNHQISDAHIYTNQIEGVKELLKRKQFVSPVLKIIGKHDNIFDYRADSFVLENYQCGAPIKFPVAI